MKAQGHNDSLSHLLSLYQSSNDQILNDMHNFYCVGTHIDESGNARTLEDFLRDGIAGADSPSSYKYNELQTVHLFPCASPIMDAVRLGVSGWQQESIDDMLSRMFHFYHYDDRNGAALLDDPAAIEILDLLSLIDPIVATWTFIDFVPNRCPMCLGTGIDPISLLLECWVCGGDGKILERVEEIIEDTIGWNVTCPVKTAFCYSNDIVNHRFKSAKEMYTLYRKKAVQAFEENDMERSFTYLGYGLHHLQDVAAVPHHAKGIPFSNGHKSYETNVASNAFSSITWTEVSSRYEILNHGILVAWRYNSIPAADMLFHMVSNWCKGNGMSVSNFRTNAVNLLAAMHYVLRSYWTACVPMRRRLYRDIGMYAKNIQMAKAIGHKRIVASMRSGRPGRRQIPNRRAIRSAARTWLQTVRRIRRDPRRRWKIPPMPRELQYKPIRIRHRVIDVSSIVQSW